MDNLIPIGTSILSACLKQAGHEVTLFDTTFYKTSEITGDEAYVSSLQIKETNLDICPKENMLKNFGKAIATHKPDIIGFSVVESTYHIAEQLMATLDYYEGVVIVGGIHATMSPNEVLQNKNVDIVCIGEGEEAIVELADKVGKKEYYYKVRNLWIKTEGGIIQNELRPIIDLNTLPQQDWSIYEQERFYKPMGGKVWISGPIELQRGCAYNCAFCCNAKLKSMFGTCYVRQKKIRNFILELREKQMKYKLSYLYLVAENFLAMKDEDFDEFVNSYRSVALPFWIETRPETIEETRVKKLKELGCEGISIGVEHGNEEFRKKVLNRFVSNEQIIRAFEIAKKSGIRVCANNIIGFPTETRELIFDTIELNHKLQADNIIVNIFCPYRGKIGRASCRERV